MILHTIVGVPKVLSTSIPISGNGGIEFRDHVPLQRRFQETFIGVGVASIFYGLNKWWSMFKRGNPDSLPL